MALQDALAALGISRVVWIDDLFAVRAPEIAEAILNNPDAARDIEELRDVIEGAEFDPEITRQRVEQIIADLQAPRRAEIVSTFVSHEAEQAETETPELSLDVVRQTCDVLDVAEGDRCSFDDAPPKLTAIMAAGDRDTCYVIDLNEGGGSDPRGLDMLRLLWDGKSEGIPFILTHAAEQKDESDKETELRQKVADDTDEPLGIPIAVIAKERLPDDASDRARIETALETGLKRAGLRRAVHAVLVRAQGQISTAFNDAATLLLRVAPEQLDQYVVARAHREGVSEMHVIERALGARISQSLRGFFGSDPVVVENARMLRNLREISLAAPEDETGNLLAEFRKAEVWDSEEIVNGSFSPIACGDVFELDRREEATKNLNRKFVLLGQPCDIALRGDGKRAQSGGILVPVKTAAADAQSTLKAPLLPFKLDGNRWKYDFREACAVRLSILDLASFRRDGRVCLDSDHAPPVELLPGQLAIYADRVGFAQKLLDGVNQTVEAPLMNEELMLMLTDGQVFKHMRTGVFRALNERQENGKTVGLPDRVTWHLRRMGRIRMPFAASLLEQLLTVMSREAFDMDF